MLDGTGSKSNDMFGILEPRSDSNWDDKSVKVGEHWLIRIRVLPAER